jgi:hypothetical protein
MGSASAVLGRPRFHTQREEEALDRPDEWGPAVSGSGARRVMGIPRPFDQVVIDGPRLSPTSDWAVRGGNPSVARQARWLT